MPETETFQNELTVAVAHGRLRDHLPGVYREGRDSLAWESMARGVALPDRWHTEVRQASCASWLCGSLRWAPGGSQEESEGSQELAWDIGG